jgi:hypothetical protein
VLGGGLLQTPEHLGALRSAAGSEAMSIARSVYVSTHDAGPTSAAVDDARTELANLIDPSGA